MKLNEAFSSETRLVDSRPDLEVYIRPLRVCWLEIRQSDTQLEINNDIKYVHYSNSTAWEQLMQFFSAQLLVRTKKKTQD